jgi:hypothetical protein
MDVPSATDHVTRWARKFEKIPHTSTSLTVTSILFELSISQSIFYVGIPGAGEKN